MEDLIRNLHPNALPILFVFCIGYLCICFEHLLKINKTAVALVMGIVCWALLFTTQACPEKSNTECFLEHLSNISQIVFFLLGSLAIVEVINIHHGFKIIIDCIELTSKKKLLWVLGFLAFFLSAVLDNLTTTIVMITLLGKLTSKSEERLLIGGGIVIAANAGGAWTPIGDVTTTMLWIGGELTTGAILKDLFLPSLGCLIVSLLFLSRQLQGEFPKSHIRKEDPKEPYANLVLSLGMGSLMMVPVFKVVTGLPPFMGVLFWFAILWIIVDLLHRHQTDCSHLSILEALRKVDLSSTLFFLGILICIATLEVTHILSLLAHWFEHYVGNDVVVAIGIGLVSAVVDNVPLVAATMGMYDLTIQPPDSAFWELIAYCAGTGGSLLVIGSAAGVVYMGLEKVDFVWYLRRIGPAALVGYFSGIAIYLIEKL